MNKRKKTIIAIGSFELVVLVFALVVAMLVLLTRVDSSQYVFKENIEAANIEKNGSFIGYLQNNSTAFFFVAVFPTLLFVALDFIYFAFAATRKDKSNDKAVEQMKIQALEEARAQIKKE